MLGSCTQCVCVCMCLNVFSAGGAAAAAALPAVVAARRRRYSRPTRFRPNYYKQPYMR